jgi:MFS family permease
MSTHKRSAWIPDFGAKGWGIVFIAAVFFYCGNSVFDAGFNSVMAVYSGTYGWAPTLMASIVTLGGWISIFGLIFFGAVCKKKGAKFTSIVGLLGEAVFFLLLAVTKTASVFAIATIGSLFCATGFMFIGVGQFGANWFPRKTGLYMGIATCGMTAGAATINLIVLNVAATSGISTFMLGAAIVCVIVAVIVGLFIHNYPEEVGCYPDNDKSVSREEIDREKKTLDEYKKNSPWTIKRVLKTKETWLVGIGWSIPMMAASGVIAQLGFALQEYGHEFMFGIMLLSVSWPIGLVGSYLAGVVDDKFGTKLASLLVVGVEAIGAVLLLIFGANTGVATVGVGLMLFAIAGVTNITVSMSTTVFGRRDFENFWPTISTIYKFIVCSGVTVIAFIARALNYRWAFAVVIALCVVAFIIMLFTTGKCITDDKLVEEKIF